MIARPLILGAALLWTGSAWAACSSPNACTCSISLTPMAFGDYNPYSPSPTDTVSSMSISCVSPDPANSTMSITMSPGGSGNSDARAMSAGPHPLYYNLYSNVTRTTIWGDGSGSGEPVEVAFPPASRTSRVLSIYGRIPASQNAWVGVYHDSVTVTVTY